MMKSIVLKSFGGVENLVIGTTAKPIPMVNEVLVKVKSFALNRADILQRLGRYPPPPGDSDILGLEMSGVVAECDKNDPRFKIGDRVFGLVGGGGYGQYCTIHQSHLMHLPEHLNFNQGAAIPEAFLTAFQALHLLSDFQPHQNVLIHAAGSGVGTALSQLCKVSKATHIIGTCGSQEKEEFIRALGVTETINYKNTEDFSKKVLEVTNGKGVNVVFDYVGAKYWNYNLKSLAMDGTMVVQGLLSGGVIKNENVDISSILSKRLTIKGSTLRNRSIEYKTGLIKQFESTYLNLFESGELKPIIDKVFKYNEIQEAHKYLESNSNCGKVVIESFED